MKKNKSKNIGTFIIIMLIIMITAITFINKFFDSDLFFDLKTGENLLKYGLDFKDHFSFIPNLTYMYHHYLYNLLIYGVYSIFGYNGIFLFFVLVFFFFGMTVFFVNKKNIKNTIFSAIISVFTMVIAASSFTPRVQSITYLLFFLEVYFIEKLYKTGNKKNSIFIILISILIANLHMPLWIFSVILYFPFLAEFLMSLIINKFKKIKEFIDDKLIINEPKNKKIFLTTFIILLLSGLLTPLKLYPYTFFTKSLFNPVFDFIGEMQQPALLYFIWEPIFIIILIIIMLFKKIKIRLQDLMLMLGLFVFSLIAVRNVVYVYIFFPTLIVKILFQSYDMKCGSKKVSMFFRKVNKKVVQIFTIVCLITIYSFLLYKMDFKKQEYNLKIDYPDEIVNYIKENLDYQNIKLYTDFNYGSYIAFNDIPIFVDNRAEVYIKEFNGGYDIITDYKNSKTISKYKEIFEKYKFDYALVYTESELYYCLMMDLNYEFVLEEKYYTLFKRVVD